MNVFFEVHAERYVVNIDEHVFIRITHSVPDGCVNLVSGPLAILTSVTDEDLCHLLFVAEIFELSSSDGVGTSIAIRSASFSGIRWRGISASRLLPRTYSITMKSFSSADSIS